MYKRRPHSGRGAGGKKSGGLSKSRSGGERQGLRWVHVVYFLPLFLLYFGETGLRFATSFSLSVYEPMLMNRSVY